MVEISVNTAYGNRIFLTIAIVIAAFIIFQIGIRVAHAATNSTASSTANTAIANFTINNIGNSTAQITNSSNTTSTTCPHFVPPTLTPSNNPVARGQYETLTESFAWWDLSCLHYTGPFTYTFSVVSNATGQTIASNAYISNATQGTFTFLIPNTSAASGYLTATATVRNSATPQQSITNNASILICPTPTTPFCLSSSTVSLTESNSLIDQSQYETLTSTVNVIGVCYSVTGQCPETYTFYFQVENTTSSNVVASRLFPMVYNAIGGATENFTFQLPLASNALGPLHANVVVTYNPTCPYCAQNTIYPPITASNTINAYPMPTAMLIPSNATLNHGQNETFSASISGGVAPFNIVLRFGANTIQVINRTNARNITFNSIIPPAGIDTYTLSGIDSATAPFYFTTQNTITVNPLPQSSSLLISNSLVMQGQYENLSAAFSNYSISKPYTLIFTATNALTGNSIIASPLTPMNTIYINQSLSSGPFKVQLVNLGVTNSNGISPAMLNVYYNGTLTNTTTLYPISTVHFTVGRSSLALVLSRTDDGLYYYERWAEIQLFSYSPNTTVVSNTIPAGFTFQVPLMPDALGRINSTVTITGSGSNTTARASNTFTAYPAFAGLNLTPSNYTPFLGNPDTFNAFFNGGKGPFSLNLLENGIVIKTINSTLNSFPVSFNAVSAAPVGNQSYAFTVVDYGLTTPELAQSPNAIVRVMPLPYSTLMVSNSIAAETQYERLTESFVNYSLSTTPYTYTFTVTNSINGNVIANAVITSNSATASFLFALPQASDALGKLDANVIVSDSNQFNRTLESGNIIASYPVPSLAITAGINSTLNSINYGQHVNYTMNISGGAGEFTLYATFDGMPWEYMSNITTPNTVVFGATPTAGIDTVVATATDNGLTTPYSVTASNTITTNPVVPLLVSDATPQQGQAETLTESFTLNVLGPYTFNFTVSNALTGSTIAFNSITSNTQSGAFTFTIPNIGSAMGQMDAKATVFSTNAMLYIVYSTNTFTIIPSTPPPPNGGGGGGGGGSGGGGGTFKPVVNQNGSCYTVSNFAQLGQVAITNKGSLLVNITLNYITPDYAGVTVNGQSMQLNLSEPIKIPGTTFTIALTGIQYLPILQTVTLGVCSTLHLTNTTNTTSTQKPKSNNTNATTTTIPTTSNTPTMSSNSALSPTSTAPSPLTQSVPFVGGFLLAGAGTSKLRKRMMRGRKHESYWKNDPKIIRTIEEAGLIEIGTLVATIILFYYGYALLSAVVAFAFGVSLPYFIDRIRSEENGTRYPYIRKEGARSFVEEFGVVEIAAFAVAVFMFIINQFLAMVLFAFLFGLLFAYFVDRTREISTVINGAAVLETLEPIGDAKGAKRQKRQQKIEET